MKLSFKDPRALEWIQLREWVHKYIADNKHTIQQFLEAVCPDHSQLWRYRRSLDMSDMVSTRRIVRGEEFYTNFRDVCLKFRDGSPLQFRQQRADDILKDINIHPLGSIFPLYGTTMSFHTGDYLPDSSGNHEIDITEYPIGDPSTQTVLATVYMHLVEDCADKMDRFISELSKLCIATLTERGYNGILKIKNERGWMWL
jgi:hypothetical protein